MAACMAQTTRHGGGTAPLYQGSEDVGAQAMAVWGWRMAAAAVSQGMAALGST